MAKNYSRTQLLSGKIYPLKKLEPILQSISQRHFIITASLIFWFLLAREACGVNRLYVNPIVCILNYSSCEYWSLVGKM